MLINPGAFEKSDLIPPAPQKNTPAKIMLSLVIMIFIAEMIAMALLYYLELPSYFVESLLDGLIMSFLILPGLYILQLKPLSRQMQEREKADYALRENEKLLRKVLEIMPVGVWITDASGKILHGNPASQEIWGGARYVGIDQYGEYKGWWLETGKPLNPDEWAAARAIMQGSTSINEEIEIENFDGARKIILNSATPIYDERKEVAGAVVINQDITALKRTEQALVQRVRLFSTAMENLPVGVWLTDNEGRIIYGNPAIQEIWSGARYVGIDKLGEYKGWWVDTGKRLEPEDWALARAIQKGETSLNEEIEIECFDGSHKIILNSAVPVCDEQGETIWAFVVNQDITERNQREQMLVQTNELLERFFSSIGTHIAYMDRDFNFIRVNESYASAAGHKPEFFIEKNHFDLYPHAENEAIFRRVVETGEPFRVMEKPFENPELPEQGVTYWDWSLEPVKGARGEVQGVVLSLLDVTERKRAEIKLAKQNEELRQLSDEERKQRQFAEILSAATQTLTQTLDLEQVINTLLAYFQTLVESDTTSVILLEDEARLAARYSRGFGAWAERTDIPFISIEGDTESLIKRIKLTGTSLTIPNTNVTAGNPELERIKNWLVVPIIALDKLIGWVELGRAEGEPFNSEEGEWAEALTGPAAIAIENAYLFDQLHATTDLLHSLAHKQVDILEKERYSIARELHDQAGQSLSSLKLNLGRLEQDPECTPRLQNRLHELRDATDHILEDIHRLAMDLRPAALDHLGLIPALEQLAQNMNSDELSVQFKAIGFEGKRLNGDLETTLYRIVQESLTNVLRHAHASNIGILLERSKGKIKVFIEDNGVGFTTTTETMADHLGLIGMRERAEMFGGNLVIESTSGSGTAVIVEVPDGDTNSHRG